MSEEGSGDGRLTAAASVVKTLSALRSAGIDTARAEAGWLVAHVLGLNSALDVWRTPDRVLTAGQFARLAELTDRRLRGEPLQYLTGLAGFYGMELVVGPGVLVPRPETERLVDLALEAYPGAGAVCDLCTGSGAVAFALARELPGAPTVVAIDIAPRALRYAALNRRRLGVARVHLVVGDLFAPVRPAARFAMITANPPYVSPAQYAQLPVDVRDHEPGIALLAGDDGLSVIRRIANTAPRHLTPGGVLLCEIGSEQYVEARNILAAAGFRQIAILPDHTGRPRVARATAPRRRATCSAVPGRDVTGGGRAAPGVL
ncbi:MAG: peptide chain release factor N(5)-glutamine methyltransferase [Kiritimatiellaeota bacterium]|nr:peptide chain release factor N(5)-glutamine methyltransferase [Kiritimatiellota bacterium]